MDGGAGNDSPFSVIFFKNFSLVVFEVAVTLPTVTLVVVAVVLVVVVLVGAEIQ